MLSRCREAVEKARSPSGQEQPSAGSDADAHRIDHSRGGERKLGVQMSMRLVIAVRTSGLAGLGAGAEHLFDNGLHGACTPATFDAATEAAVNLPGVARKILR